MYRCFEILYHDGIGPSLKRISIDTDITPVIEIYTNLFVYADAGLETLPMLKVSHRLDNYIHSNVPRGQYDLMPYAMLSNRHNLGFMLCKIYREPDWDETVNRIRKEKYQKKIKGDNNETV